MKHHFITSSHPTLKRETVNRVNLLALIKSLADVSVWEHGSLWNVISHQEELNTGLCWKMEKQKRSHCKQKRMGTSHKNTLMDRLQSHRAIFTMSLLISFGTECPGAEGRSLSRFKRIHQSTNWELSGRPKAHAEWTGSRSTEKGSNWWN